MIKGKIISGQYGNILVRQKSKEHLELGELLIAETARGKILLQVFDLIYGSQISQANLELISGMGLEENSDQEFMDPELRNYTLAKLKTLLTIENNTPKAPKILPDFFSTVRALANEDLSFLTKPENPLFIGKLRSGSKVCDFDIFLDGEKAFTHHILIAASTGKGKTNIMKSMLWQSIDKDYCSILVLDPHDEYYGRNSIGLKDHEKKVIYYTPNNPPPGCRTLKINLCLLRPSHFNGVIEFSDPQKQALNMFHRKYGRDWIEAVILEKPLDVQFKDDTLAVIRRRLLWILDLEFSQNQLFCNGVFDLSAGESTIEDICSELEQSKIVIIDTSNFSGSVELLIGSMIANEIFNRYKKYKIDGMLKDRPVVSIVLEEAPRVLGKDVLEQGPNIFSTVAREGRKFKVGLTAITQLPSLIPRSILANMNTKIILGMEMAPERQAIIDSASQDLSEDTRTIASLDIGEAIVSSNFTKFAIPIKIPLFEELVKLKKAEMKRDFSGVKV